MLLVKIMCLTMLILLMISVLIKVVLYTYGAWKEDRDEKFWIAMTVFAIVTLVVTIVAYVVVFVSIVTPDETIEKDGYTYVLDKTPEESIEVDGRTYILSDTSTEAPVAVPQETAVSE